MPLIKTLKHAKCPKYGWDLTTIEKLTYPFVIEFATQKDAELATRARRMRIERNHDEHHSVLTILTIDDCLQCLQSTSYRG